MLSNRDTLITVGLLSILCCIFSKLWKETTSTLGMISTVLMVSLYIIEYSLQCSLYPFIELGVPLPSADSIPPQYWCYPATVLNILRNTAQTFPRSSLRKLEAVFSLCSILRHLRLISLFFFCVLDLNECRINLRLCQQDCVNTLGSYRCECRSGYILKADRRGCRGKIVGNFLGRWAIIRLSIKWT